MIDILDALKLEIVIENSDSEGIDVVARSHDPLTGGRFIVRGIWQVPGEIVDQPHVIRLAEHVRAWSPERVAPITGLPAATIVEFARRYGATRRGASPTSSSPKGAWAAPPSSRS